MCCSAYFHRWFKNAVLSNLFPSAESDKSLEHDVNIIYSQRKYCMCGQSLVLHIWVNWGLRRLHKVCTCSIEYSICAYEWLHVYNCLALLQLLHYIILILYKFVTLMTELNQKHLQFSDGESLLNPPRSLCPWISSLDSRLNCIKEGWMEHVIQNLLQNKF